VTIEYAESLEAVEPAHLQGFFVGWPSPPSPERHVELLRGSAVLMSIHLDFTLSGPTRWRAHGNARVKILFFSVSVGFDVSWGDDRKATLPPADARAPLLAALGDARNWSAALPAGAEQGVSLGPGPDAAGRIVVHPLGRLTVRQRVVPLNVTITRFGSGAPERWNSFSVTDVAVAGRSVTQDFVKDRFARGQFFELSDDDKLSKPAFEPMDAGVQVGLDNGRFGHVSPLELRYETNIVDDVHAPSRRLVALFRPEVAAFAAQIAVGAAAESPVLRTGDAKFVAPGTAGGVATADVLHVIASTDDLRMRTDVGGGAATRTEAEIALARHLALHPEDRGTLHVIAAHEAAPA